MRISNLLSALCAAAVCAGATTVRAQNTPAQAAALAALKQKMSEMDAQTPPPANPSLQPVVVTPAAAPVERTNPAVAPPPAAPAAVTPVAKPVTPAAPRPVARTVAPPRATTPVLVSNSSGFFTPLPPPSNPDTQTALPAPKTEPAAPLPSVSAGSNPATSTAAKASPPPQVKTTKTTAAKPAEPKQSATPSKEVAKAKSKDKLAATKAKPAKPGEVVYPGKALGFAPIEAPPPPVSAQQEAALHALLDRYMADEITPEQYQVERKKILAGQ